MIVEIKKYRIMYSFFKLTSNSVYTLNEKWIDIYILENKNFLNV